MRWGWMTDESDYEWQAQRQGQKPEKQSVWEAKLSRKARKLQKYEFQLSCEIEKW